MAAPQPRPRNLADLYDLAPLDWADVRGTLETNLTQEPGTGGLATTPSGCRRSTPTAGPT
jgi:hypothetical protein